ncbi:ZPR1 zinc finger domain-containing protein [Candidatus Methanosphaera massiliense]|jgi:zinc finger protein|uniref:ZPR1 zinc finger domain-containing protein n=1 Tax=Methanosphaera TaxID=2316 RepID=UPI0023803C16|nr:ZPR1 zinc finger domain-containing protein [Candidatus Methanosphaera massiliense]MDD6285149.1 ZPR1 zinc finger domain-containing protein [Methanobacteriaceae archaeon]MDE4078362.1 ZPR1 zinc finger domain-containing protein [Candidatus Methanosphaera massiliense]
MMNEENNMKEEIMKSDCPVCGGKNTLEVRNKTDNIPYFGDILETSVVCSKCGYQSSDNISLQQNDPSRYTLLINDTKLNTRVAKSQTATITIPELGLKVEPGPKSQGYVSNVEGILTRFEEAVIRALTLEGEELSKEVEDNAMRILQLITNIKIGELTTELILEDPFGNSVIDDDDANKELLSQEEADKLETGFTTIDQ